jgi:hypothetical protein
MRLDQASLRAAVEPVLAMALGVDPDAGRDAMRLLKDRPDERWLVGTTRVSGTVDALVTFACPAPAARSVAVRMLGIPAERTCDDDLVDTVGELANQVGGAVKPLLAGVNSLELPRVRWDRDASRGRRNASEQPRRSLVVRRVHGPFEVRIEIEQHERCPT